MLKNPFKRKPSDLNMTIFAVLSEMENEGIDVRSDEYEELLGRLERLMRLKQEERKNRVSPDTIAIVIGNLAGILIIVSYERVHVMASRGLSFILKTR